MQKYIPGFYDPLGGLIALPPSYSATSAAGEAFAAFAGAPTAGAAGYAPGCIYVNLSGSIGTMVYVNVGSNTSATWVSLDGGDGVSVVTLITTTTITALAHSNRTLVLSLLAGFTTTMPAATGSGLTYYFNVGIVVTSGSYVISVPAGTMYGNIVNGISGSGGAANTYTQAAGTSITLDAAHKGGATIGDWIQLQDVATATWYVRGVVTGTTALATPFS